MFLLTKQTILFLHTYTYNRKLLEFNNLILIIRFTQVYNVVKYYPFSKTNINYKCYMFKHTKWGRVYFKN